MYTSQLWWNYKKVSINKLYIAYHNIFKLFLGLSKYESTSVWCALMDVSCGCAAVICKLIFCFICRLNMSENILINNYPCQESVLYVKNQNALAETVACVIIDIT